MDLQQFLATIVPADLAGVQTASTIVGALTFAIIESADKLAGRLGWVLSGTVKLIASITLALLIPSAGYALQIALGYATFGANAMFLAVAVIGWALSQLAHGALQAK
jgi:hypothetical protein